jgi:hypothetical protein
MDCGSLKKPSPLDSLEAFAAVQEATVVESRYPRQNYTPSLVFHIGSHKSLAQNPRTHKASFVFKLQIQLVFKLRIHLQTSDSTCLQASDSSSNFVQSLNPQATDSSSSFRFVQSLIPFIFIFKFVQSLIPFMFIFKFVQSLNPKLQVRLQFRYSIFPASFNLQIYLQSLKLEFQHLDSSSFSQAWISTFRIIFPN